jgi:pyruvate,orthophosphate dikinase
MAEKWVYLFEEGTGKQKDLLGGKGADLAEMTRLNFPIPPGFTITTKACNEFHKIGKKLPPGCWEQSLDALKKIEKKTGKQFGNPENPLLVSVRSGAPISMPGMMDTILNLGLNEDITEGIAKATGDRRFALDVYRRFIQMFSDIVLKIPSEKFEDVLTKIREKEGVKYDKDISVDGLENVIREYKAIVKQNAKREFPMKPEEQLKLAILAVFDSWNNKRAVTYRKINSIPDNLGTAVNVQTMVFGNMGEDSATGVAFTRNPSNGNPELYGEYLVNAQGEDVVAGTRTPQPIEKMKEELPEVYNQLLDAARTLEKHYRDTQDLEFTIQNGKLYMLQTRTGKRSAQAAVKIAHDMVVEKLISKKEAVLRVEPEQLEQLLHPRIDPSAKIKAIAKGLNASPGAASGKVIFDTNEADELGHKGERIILVRPETTPEDIHGIVAAQGILTSRGGMTCHAAVVARGMGKPAVVGAGEISIDMDKEEFRADGVIVKKWDVITIDGSTGSVMLGSVPTVEPEMGGDVQAILEWADETRRIGVRANADTPTAAKRARDFGAEGIGLCRTERMFNDPSRLPIVQEMIMAKDEKGRRVALEKLKPIQKEDFKGIFRVMDGLPVTIRLIDLPLHEFLPNFEGLLVEVTENRLKGKVDEKKELVLKRLRELMEHNPMLGHRGCRIGIRYPEIYEMQVKAIMEAACELKKEGVSVEPEIMMPLIGHYREMETLRELAVKAAEEVISQEGIRVEYKIGTMIELPRGAITAGKIAEYADFFSFGTNDLTQTTFGYSRDDAEAKFLPDYLGKGILKENPFEVLDRDGVGRVVAVASKEGKEANPKLKLGICGEHGGNPSSIEFFYETGLDYVSCSGYRVPIARLAAAHATLKDKIR